MSSNMNGPDTFKRSVRWLHATKFDRARFQCKRYQDDVKAAISAQYAFAFYSIGGNGLQNLLLLFGQTVCLTAALSQSVYGEISSGKVVALYLYWVL